MIVHLYRQKMKTIYSFLAEAGVERHSFIEEYMYTETFPFPLLQLKSETGSHHIRKDPFLDERDKCVIDSAKLMISENVGAWNKNLREREVRRLRSWMKVFFDVFLL